MWIVLWKHSKVSTELLKIYIPDVSRLSKKQSVLKMYEIHKKITDHVGSH